MAVSVGQITIMDYNDALTLTGFITSNLSKTQRYSADTGTFTPDWTGVSLVLTPSLFILGSGTDQIAVSAVQSGLRCQVLFTSLCKFWDFESL
jgi:hypothetical protein